MGLKIKVDGVEQKTNETPMTQDLTERLWEVINENTELRQQVTMLNAKLDRVRDILNR